MNLRPKLDPVARPRVLICEDEPIVALDLQFLVEGYGFDVLGPHSTVARALSALERERPDAAILDVRLGDGEVFPVAERLQEMGVPLIFHSGHTYDDEIRARFPGAACCQKPIVTSRLEDELRRVTQRASVE
ncbi:response regulator [Roseivivax halodurans JCM 10272]|uniref:Response regulator n=1 Tax=Roseivivax halodurans JCM 10272 TaxID=1449350 RepID=X7EN53_9RHOB|nr:response regulator [Roseivivax halodurans]ETX16593.1 response regulator [Roseivivax halodurans JCM 10272]